MSIESYNKMALLIDFSYGHFKLTD